MNPIPLVVYCGTTTVIFTLQLAAGVSDCGQCITGNCLSFGRLADRHTYQRGKMSYSHVAVYTIKRVTRDSNWACTPDRKSYQESYILHDMT
jgi:hypothetical protein